MLKETQFVLLLEWFRTGYLDFSSTAEKRYKNLSICFKSAASVLLLYTCLAALLPAVLFGDAIFCSFLAEVFLVQSVLFLTNF